MNERIKELAEQAGIEYSDLMKAWVAYGYHIERFAELVRQDEREACAKLCGEKLMQTPYGEVVSAAIRARSNRECS